TIFIGMPILLAEFIIGRSSQKDAIRAYKTFAPNSNWHFIGVLGMLASVILLSFYSVVGGWILLYIGETVVGNLSDKPEGEYGLFFNVVSAVSVLAIGSQSLFMVSTIVVVAKGIQKSIENASKIMMPSLFIAFIILIMRSLTQIDITERLTFFLYPNL